MREVHQPDAGGPGRYRFIGDDLALAAAQRTDECNPAQQLESAGAGLRELRAGIAAEFLAIAVDQMYPCQSALDFAAPSLSVTTTGSPPAGVTSGWLFHLSAGNVQLTRILPLSPGETASDVRQGCVVRLVETEGRAKSTVVRCFRSPVAARPLAKQTVTAVPCWSTDTQRAPSVMC